MYEKSSGTCLTDRDRMEDLLAQEKYLIDGYSTFISEASCPQLRQVLNENLNSCFNNQFVVFDKMNQLGWYSGKVAQQNEICAAQQMYSRMQQELG